MKINNFKKLEVPSSVVLGKIHLEAEKINLALSIANVLGKDTTILNYVGSRPICEFFSHFHERIFDADIKKGKQIFRDQQQIS